jgi:RNA polymerase sigma factor (sigma-70 family)
MPSSEPPRPEPDNADTLHLARAASRGDIETFGLLYERIAPALYTWAEIRIRPSVRAWIDPGDLVQEVWCRALRILDRFDPEKVPFRYWIFRVAKNVLLEATRKVSGPEGRAQTPGTTSRMNVLAEVPDSVTGISLRLSRNEELERFRDWVRELEAEERDLLLHHGLEGLSHEQVATRMQLGVEAVAKRWQRLRRKLEEQALPREVLAVIG